MRPAATAVPAGGRGHLRALLALLLCLLACYAGPSVAGRDLLGDGRQWSRVSWKSHGTAEPDASVHHGSGTSFRIADDTFNDIRLVRRIAVKPGRFYRFSAWVRTEDVVGRVGANLSVDGSYNRSRVRLIGTQDWTHVERVFRAVEPDRLTFALRLGYWNATARGTAWFDRVELEELESWDGDYEPVRRSGSSVSVSTFPLRLLVLVFAVPFLYGGLAWLRRMPAGATGPGIAPRAPWTQSGFWALLAAGLAARLFFVGQPVPWVDVPAAEAWALHLAGPSGWSGGTPPAGLAAPPPLWLYWLGFAGAVVKGFVLENNRLFTVLLQLPSITVEMAAVAGVLAWLRSRMSGAAFLLAAGFVVLHPALLLGTALAGFPATLGAGLVLLSLFMAWRSRYAAAGVLLGLGIAAAPVLLWLVVPVLLWSGSRRGGRPTVVLGGVAAVVLVATVLPVAGFYDPRDALAMAGGLAGATLAAAVPGVAVWLAAVVFVYRRLAGEAAALPLAAPGLLVVALTLMAVVTGPDTAVLHLAVAASGLLLAGGARWRWLFLLLGLLATWYWGHEYVSATVSGDGRLVGDLAGVFGRVGIAVLAVLAWWGMSGPAAGAPQREGWRRRAGPWAGRVRGLVRPHPAGPVSGFGVTRADVVAVIAIWLFGLALILHGIGERVYPLHAYKVEAAEEVFEVVFAQPVHIREVRVYTGANGAGAARFEVEGEDGWERLWKADDGQLRYKGGQRERRSTFKQLWRRIPDDRSTGRLRVTLTGAGTDINEIVFLDREMRPLAPRLLEQKAPENEAFAASAHPLFDEGHRITAEKGFRAKTFWDEVYYARSGYELASGLEPYERSHPPLGKILVSWGVDLFGMTPFGWRFMDALVVSLLPVVLWLAARSMFGLRHAAYAAAFLAVFELMFFIHGRWANIDTFLAFFLTVSLLSLFFWYRRGHGRFTRDSLGWFVLAGFSFGCAVATKWSALFTGFAVFVLWMIAQLSAIAGCAGAPDRGERLARYFGRELPRDILAWGLGFVVLPALIYYFSYAPVLAAMPGAPHPLSAGGWQAFVDQQQFQLHYHADKEGGHSSSSMFFTWPIMLQPASMLTRGGLADGTTATINILGNPVIWWTGFAAMLGLGWRALRGRDEVAVFLAGIYFLQGLPWLLVTRTTYIYHYYPFLPLLILGTVYWLVRLDTGRRAVRVALGVFAVLVVAGFAAYYPYVTGTPVPVAYTEAVRLFDTWSRL